MGYDKTTWVQGVAPGMSAANLNNLETQYEKAIADLKALFNAHSILMAIADNDPVALTIAASRIIGRKATGNIGALTGAEVLAILNGQAGADFSMNSKRITNLLAPNAAGHALRKGTRVTPAELPALADEKIWKGTGANVEELTIALSRIVGRKAAGDVVALTGTEVRTLIGWTANKLLKGAGAGIAPTLIDPYTDAAAKAAAVQSGVITNGVTKAPTHDAVYDVKQTADIATTPAEVDTKILTHKNIAGAHHTKTTNASELTAGELPSARLAANQKLLTITFIIEGIGGVITTGVKGHLEIPFACTISQVTMLADRSGSIVVDIWKDTYANFPPDNADSITASAPPTISGAQKSQDSTLSGWTKSIAAGDILAFNVDSITDIQRVTVSLKVVKS